MDLTIALIGVVLIIVAIWVFLELKRFRHRLLAVFLIALILFTYFSFTYVFANKPLNLSSMDGIKQAGVVYYSWLSSVFTNLVSITTNAIKLNWGVNNSTLNQTNLSG
jgi:predicted Kef-type K+ transport protein